MKTKQIIFFAVIISALAFAFFYFGFIYEGNQAEKNRWKANKETLGRLEGQLKGLANQIKASQGETSCEFDRQCKAVGLGTKVCGNFKDYLIYSTHTLNNSGEKKLLLLISEFNTLHAKMADASFEVSGCGIPPTEIQCIDHECTPKVK